MEENSTQELIKLLEEAQIKSDELTTEGYYSDGVRQRTKNRTLRNQILIMEALTILLKKQI